MADYAEADARLMDWLAERTDTQLQRLLDAPEDGLTNERYHVSEDDDGVCRACLAGWAFGWNSAADSLGADTQDPTSVLVWYGLPFPKRDDGTIMRRIQGFAAAELLTRRVERKALPPAREVVTA